ncbi:MAG: DUF2127 domain-containing protein [Cyanobacteria bacterium P01_H01_bin.35]
METQSPERTSLKFIILYKGIIATFMLLISLISGWSWRNFENLATWAEINLINGEFQTIELILKPILNADIPSLKLVARYTAIYGSLIIIGLVGLWYEKFWSKILFVGLVGVPLPLEVKELIHDFSLIRLTIFILNLSVFVFLIIRELKPED